jgi:hypothetical protein
MCNAMFDGSLCPSGCSGRGAEHDLTDNDSLWHLD